MAKIRNKVRAARAEKGFTQQELAERTGVTRQTIGLIENEKHNPTIALGLNLSRELGRSLDELFWLEADDHGDQ